MLRNVALRGADTIDKILHAGLFGATKNTQDFQPQRVRHGL